MKGKIKEMMKDTMNFPKELLYISRNMNLVRSLNKFHGGIADRIPILARAAFYGTTLSHSNCKP
jgi:aarF domain-containing kinase